jgi:hypothetical protein
MLINSVRVRLWDSVKREGESDSANFSRPSSDIGVDIVPVLHSLDLAATPIQSGGLIFSTLPPERTPITLQFYNAGFAKHTIPRKNVHFWLPHDVDDKKGSYSGQSTMLMERKDFVAFAGAVSPGRPRPG